MKNKKIIIVSTILIIFSGLCIVMAKTVLFSSIKLKNNRFIGEKKLQTKSISHKSLKHALAEDEDSYTNYIFADRIKLYNSNGGVIKITDMNPASAKSAYGNPTSETIEFSEYYNSNILTYHYPNGNIAFIDDDLLSIEGLDEGFSFEITKTDGTTFRIIPGSESGILYDTFTSSWENGVDIKTPTGTRANVTVFLKSETGEKTDASITFTLVYGIGIDPYNNTVNKVFVKN